MDAATLIKYILAIQGLSNLKVSFEPPEGQVLVWYTDQYGRQVKEITFAELSNLLTTSNPGPPAAPPG
ncbi:hypothetical protein MUP46_02415 [Patescibacteria group bacterium]|nr:hypothetical protein [Patescibacteria group bacterium]